MEGYINDARKAAWGNSGVGAGLNVDSLTDTNGSGDSAAAAGNRKQRRAAKAAGSGTSTPTPEKQERHVAKRKVTSENGKTFIVTSLGDVSLVEEDEEGNVQEFLLDLEEIPKAEWKRTAMVTLPKRLYDFVVEKTGLSGLSGFGGGKKGLKQEVDDVAGDITFDGPGGIDEVMEKKGIKKRTKVAGKR